MRGSIIQTAVIINPEQPVVAGIFKVNSAILVVISPYELDCVAVFSAVIANIETGNVILSAAGILPQFHRSANGNTLKQVPPQVVAVFLVAKRAVI